MKVAGGLEVFRARNTLRPLKTFTLAAGKWQKYDRRRFPDASRNSPRSYFCHFPAARVKVLSVRKVFRARNTLRTLKTFTLAAGKWQKYDRGEFLDASGKRRRSYFCHFPAARVKVLSGRKVFRARNTSRPPATFTFPTGKC